jgi:hypothetical protein
MNFKTRLLCLPVALITIGIGSKPVARTAASIVPDGKRELPDKLSQAKLIGSYGKLPLSFEANHGQTDQRVKFLSRGRGYALFLTSDETVLSLQGNQAHPKEETVVAPCSPCGASPLPGLSSVQATDSDWPTSTAALSMLSPVPEQFEKLVSSKTPDLVRLSSASALHCQRGECLSL